MAREAGPVLIERPAEHVLLVTINRPAARNAIDALVAASLEAVAADVERDPTVRVVLLTGAGDRAFCAGADLKAVAAGKAAAITREGSGFAGFVDMPRSRPWIAVVNGAALGGGCEIALACDMIVASREAVFGLPEVKRSLIAGAGGVYRLPRRMPPHLAMEMILTGEPIDAERAAALGLVNRVVPAGQELAAALSIAGRIAANAPLAVRESLMIARLAHDENEVALRRRSDDALARLRVTEDYREGPRAFAEKRAPRWSGR